MYDSSNRTICSRPPSPSNDSLTIYKDDNDGGYDDPGAVSMYMDVFTSNASGVDYSFVFEPVKDFQMELVSFLSCYNELALFVCCTLDFYYNICTF